MALSAEEKRAANLAKTEEKEKTGKAALRHAKRKLEEALARKSKLPAFGNGFAAPAVGALGGYSAGWLSGRAGSAENPHWPAFVKGAVETVVGVGLSAFVSPTWGEQVSNLAAGTWGFVGGDSGYKHGQESKAKANGPAPTTKGAR